MWYGSIAPDLTWYSADPANPVMFGLHSTLDVRPYAFTPIEQAFASGWAAHGEMTGADRMAHWEWDHVAEGYVIERAKLLPVPADIGHFAIEAAIDLLLKRQDPTLGQQVVQAAFTRSEGIPAFLVGAYAQNGVNDPPFILTAEAVFRQVVIQYGAALSLPAPYDRTALAQMGVAVAAGYGYPITAEQADALLIQAMSVCHDYMRVINEAIRQVKANQ
jgi:hypothetical protein